MKKLCTTIALVCYLIFAISCSHNHNQAERDHQDAEIHDHENHDHDEHAQDENHQHDPTYGVIEIQPQDYQEIIHTSGKIMPAQGDEVTLTAAHSGVVIFGNKSLFPGKTIQEGELLATISGKGFIHDNIENTFKNSKTAHETAKANYERAQLLNEDKIVSDKDLAELKMVYEQAKNNYETVTQNYSVEGQKVSASANGFIKDLFVTEGQFVNAGQALLKITKNKRVVIKADVPQRYFSMLSKIESANFSTVYGQKVYNTEELNGKLISYGKSTGDNSLFTPVYFEVDHAGELLAGSYVEVYLKTAVVPNSIVVPKSALMEEAGRYYVYAENGGNFKKRYLTIDCHDGENVHITEGLQIGDHVATKDPYQIKLSSMSDALPAQGHQH